MNTIDLFPRSQSPLAPASYSIFVILLGLFFALLRQARSKYQRILPNVPVSGVGGVASSSDLKEARISFRHGSKSMLLEGYQKYKGTPFYVPTPRGERLMLPPRYIEELKNLPNETADFPATFVEMFLGEYTTIGTEQTLHPRVIKDQLNQYLPVVLSEVDDEVIVALADLIPKCNQEDWVELSIMDVLTRTVARASSRMFAGKTLSRQAQWTDAIIAFTNDSFLAAQRLKDFPPFIRPVAQYFIPELKKVFDHFSLAERLIVPICDDRERSTRREVDLLQWMIDNAEGRSKRVLSAISLHVAFAAIHTSAIAVTHIIYDLCAYPEYWEPIRQEIASALAEGPPSKKTLLKMKKLDSFMRESQRFNPLLLITFERVMRHDYKFKDGFTVPKNTQIGVPAHAIGLDPALYDDPEKFDGFRFCKLRESNPLKAGQQTYTAANLTNMSWGYGRHACPGRWFADAEIKVILCHLLMEYDFQFPAGKGRPESLEFETQNLPDRSATVLIRKRKVE